MRTLPEEFFREYCAIEINRKFVYSEDIPIEMMSSKKDESGWFEWKCIPGTLTNDDYKQIERQYNAQFPISFIAWHKLYFFPRVDCSLLRLPGSLPTKPLEEITNYFEWDISEELIREGFVPFGDEGNDAGPLVFDTRTQIEPNEFPIRFYDHEYCGDMDGVSDIIFSSFPKLLECIIHYLKETETKYTFEVIPDFFNIDPLGAGKTGKGYWLGWADMLRANFEEFGR